MYNKGSFEEQSMREQQVRECVAQFMDVHEVYRWHEDELPTEDRVILSQGDSELRRSFTGTLKGQANAVHDALDNCLKEFDHYALLRPNPLDEPDAPHMIHIAQFRPERPKPSSPTVNIVLFVLTVISVLLTGTTIALSQMEYEQEQASQAIADVQSTEATPNNQTGSSTQPAQQTSSADSPGFFESVGVLFANLWRGIPYAAAIMLILVPHEMGHYLMMRRQQIVASLPYFIPAPLISPFGTFGAAIQLRETLKNRRKLLDVGAAGPIAGFIFAVPILIIGLATSPVVEMSGPVGFVEGNSILYAFSKFLVFGEVLPAGGRDVLLNQLAWAGWTGLFVTAINMIPLGQLDGGHVLYSLFGDSARKLYWPLLGVMVLLTLFVSSVWLLIALMLFFVGRVYAVPMETITPLDRPRRMAGVAALIIFVLTFPPVPIYVPGQSGGLLTGMIGAVVGLSLLRRWWHLRQIAH